MDIVNWLSQLAQNPFATKETGETDPIEDDWMTTSRDSMVDPIIDTTPAMKPLKRSDDSLDDDETLLRLFDEAERDNLLGFIEQHADEDDFFSEVLSSSKRPRLEKTPIHKSFLNIRNTLPTEITSLNAFSISVLI